MPEFPGTDGGQIACEVTGLTVAAEEVVAVRPELVWDHLGAIRNGYNTRSSRVRRQGLDPRTRGLRVRCSDSFLENLSHRNAMTCGAVTQPREAK